MPRCAWGWLGLLIVIAGCNGRSGIAPRDQSEALARVNDNLSKIDQPLRCKGRVSFRFTDADGKDRRFIGHEASLMFHRPRDLLLDVGSLVGTVAQFGSNQQRYWVWVDVEDRKLWHGQWDKYDRGAPHRMALPPDDLLDALMLRPLPQALAGGLGPLLRKDGDDHYLLLVRLDDSGQPSGWREIRLDPYEPYQPLEIIDRLPNGDIQMYAQLENYRRIGDDGPYTPRRYVIYWPLDEVEMRLDVHQARFRPDLQPSVEDIFEFPYEWDGEKEDLDAEVSPGISCAAHGDRLWS